MVERVSVWICSALLALHDPRSINACYTESYTEAPITPLPLGHHAHVILSSPDCFYFLLCVRKNVQDFDLVVQLGCLFWGNLSRKNLPHARQLCLHIVCTLFLDFLHRFHIDWSFLVVFELTLG